MGRSRRPACVTVAADCPDCGERVTGSGRFDEANDRAIDALRELLIVVHKHPTVGTCPKRPEPS